MATKQEDDNVDESWSSSTIRYLRSTLPYDSGNAILFVPQQNQGLDHRSISDEVAEDEKFIENSNSLTGEEARGFYEQVLALPEQSTTTDKAPSKSSRVARRRRRSRLRKLSSSKITDHSSNATVCPVTAAPSQVFSYAQNNQLNLLESALSVPGVDVNQQDGFHWTLLMIAAHAGHVTMVQYLLSRGAEWREHFDKKGRNAADLARLGGHHNVAELLEKSQDSIEDYRNQSPSLSSLSSSAHFSLEKDNISSSKRSHCHTPAPQFYCELCQMRVQDSPKGLHKTSTTHLFCQHHHHTTTRDGTNPSLLYGIPESNRGFQMMLRGGWDPERGLGSQKQGKQFPVKTVLKQDRLGFGLDRGKAKVTHFSAHDRKAVCIHRGGNRLKVGEKQVPKKKRDMLRDRAREREWEMDIRRQFSEIN